MRGPVGRWVRIIAKPSGSVGAVLVLGAGVVLVAHRRKTGAEA
ncbi:hypothetical protein [Streptomyces sp. NPDC045251]